MHKRGVYRFDTKAEALAFIESEKANTSPDEGFSYSGPFYTDFDTLYRTANPPKGLEFEPYWLVHIERFR